MEFMVQHVGGEDLFSDKTSSYGFIEEEYIEGQSSGLSWFAFGSQLKTKPS